MNTVNPRNLPTIDYRKLHPFQQNLKDLSKENYAKLLASIKKHGFFVPVYVWFDGAGEAWINDGHQRDRVLIGEKIVFENTGYEVPFVEITAGSIQEAKEKLLVVSSQYGKITQEGLDEFAFDLDLPSMDLAFDALPLLGTPTPDDGPPEDEAAAPEEPVPAYAVIVTCVDEAQQMVLAEELRGRGLSTKFATVQVDEKSLQKILNKA